MEEGIEEINDEKSKIKKKEQKKRECEVIVTEKNPIMFNKNNVLITNPATIPY